MLARGNPNMQRRGTTGAKPLDVEKAKIKMNIFADDEDDAVSNYSSKPVLS